MLSGWVLQCGIGSGLPYLCWGVSELALEAVECTVDVRLNDQEIWRTMMLRWEAMWDADWLQG
jgi:hypothetical protein